MTQKQNKPTKYFKISEQLWLIISIGAVAWAIVIAFTDSFRAAKVYFILSAIAIVYYFVKRMVRKRIEKRYEEGKQNNHQ